MGCHASQEHRFSSTSGDKGLNQPTTLKGAYEFVAAIQTITGSAQDSLMSFLITKGEERMDMMESLSQEAWGVVNEVTLADDVVMERLK